jgi:hypothetical protein
MNSLVLLRMTQALRTHRSRLLIGCPPSEFSAYIWRGLILLWGELMNTIGVAVYSLAIAKSRARKLELLGKFDGKNDLLAEILAILEKASVKTHDVNGAAKKFRIRDLKSAKRKIEGILEVGNFGYGSSLRDIRTGDENYKRKVSDAEMIPLYFSIWLPADETRGILALQYFGEVGGKSGLQDLIETSIHKKFDEFTLRIRKLVSEKFIKNAIETKHVAKLRFIQKGIPKDIADAYGDGAHDPDTGACAEFIIKVGKKESFAKKVRTRLVEAMSGERSVSDILELEGFEYHEVRAEVDIGGRMRTIRLGRVDGMSPRIDVTEDIETDADGHPKRPSIASACNEIIEEFAAQLQAQD